MNDRLLFLLGITIATTGAGCTRQPAAPTPPPATVLVSYPLEKEIAYHTDFTGRTAAKETVDVRAHVYGYLDKINFKEGDMVKKDDVLFEIDPRTYQAQYEQAKADLQSKKALVVKTEAVYKRTGVLVKTSAASLEDLDNTRADWDVAKANVGLSEASLKTAELNLGFTKVTAQISGRISKYNVTVGNFIQSGDQGGGTVLTNIVSMDPMYANFDVDEATVLHVRKMMREGKAKSARDGAVPVLMGLGNDEGFPYEGVINFVDNQINPKTGTLRLRGVFDNKKDILTPGLFVRVRVLIGDPRKVLTVTERAIDSDQGQKIVYTVNDKNEVVVRPVELGSLEEGQRVIESGLTAKERVVVNGLQLVRPGAIVDPKEVDMPATKK